MPPPTIPIDLFIAHAGDDDKLRAALQKHLASLQNEGLIAIFHAGDVRPGEDRRKVIAEHLARAGVVLVLVSADLLASRECLDDVDAALRRRAAGEPVAVVPVILRSCDWRRTSFGGLTPLPELGKPVTQWTHQDEALASVADAVRTLAAGIQGARPSPSRSPAPPQMPHEPPVDFLLFAPLEEERDALLSKLPGHRRLDADGRDVHVYFEAKVATRRQDAAVYRVIVTSPSGMGPVQAAITASAAATRWQPAHVIVVGIAGGLQAEVSLGDVMVARSVADYTSGKVAEDGAREERWEMVPADAGLLHAANALGRTGWEDLVAETRPEGTDKPARHVGVVASGGDVIASKDLIALYRKDMPKLIGVDMEGGGVAAALHNHKPRPGFLMVRGVSDLADGEGNADIKKRWRAYARDVAAAYVLGLLRVDLGPAALRSTTERPR